MHAIGIDNKKGTCTNKKCEKVFKIAIKPKLNPFKCIINNLHPQLPYHEHMSKYQQVWGVLEKSDGISPF